MTEKVGETNPFLTDDATYFASIHEPTARLCA
jgi:hypothetical protein